MSPFPADPAEVLSRMDATRNPRPEQEVVYCPPETEIERTMAGIWAEVLNLREVGTQDDFFLLGGDSLSMTQIISRVREQCGFELSFGDFFDYPTIASQLERLGR